MLASHFTKGFKRVAANAAWLLFDKVIRMGLGVIVMALVARYLGPEEFGTLNYVIAFASFFGILSGFGLDAIVVRELVKEPEKEDAILCNAFVAKLLAALLSLAVAFLVVSLYPQSPLINISIIIITAGFLFQCFDVVDFYYQATLLSKYTVIARNISFLITSGFKVFLILNQYGLIFFVYAAVLEVVLGSVFLGVSFFNRKRGKIPWVWDLRYTAFLVKQSYPLVLSGFVIVLYMRIDQIMLGEFLDQSAVGYYSAAIKLTEVWYFLPTIICSSALPSIIKSKLKSNTKYENDLKNLYSVLNVISMGIAVPITFLAYPLMEVIYGTEYFQSGGVLSISIWAGIFAFLSVGTGQYLIIENLTRIAFVRNLFSAVVNILLNIVLIPMYGVKGAALATLFSYFLSVSSLVLFKATRNHFLLVARSFLLLNSKNREIIRRLFKKRV